MVIIFQFLILHKQVTRIFYILLTGTSLPLNEKTEEIKNTHHLKIYSLSDINFIYNSGTIQIPTFNKFNFNLPEIDLNSPNLHDLTIPHISFPDLSNFGQTIFNEHHNLLKSILKEIQNKNNVDRSDRFSSVVVVE